MNDTITIRHDEGQVITSISVPGIEEFIVGTGDDLADSLRDLADNFEALRESL
jgi:hypothetical protein